MKYTDRHRHQSVGRHRSSSLALDPYFIDDVAITRSELEQARTTDVTVVIPR